MIGALLLDQALWRSYASTFSVGSVRLAAYGSAVLKHDLHGFRSRNLPPMPGMNPKVQQATQ